MEIVIDIEPLNFHRRIGVDAGVGSAVTQQRERPWRPVHVNQQVRARGIGDFCALQRLAERRPDVGRELRWVVVGTERPGEDSLGDLGNGGRIVRGGNARVWRSSKVIATDRIESLRRFRDDVREVQTSYECGIGLANFHDLEEGDVIESFTSQTISRAVSA